MRIALFDFEPRNSQELSLTKGDIIQVVSSESDVGAGWWVGKKTLHDGTSLVGVFPANYTADITDSGSNKVYSPKVSKDIHKRQEDIGFLIGGPPGSALIEEQQLDQNMQRIMTSTSVVEALQQELRDKESRLFILEKTKADLEQQLKKLASDHEAKMKTLEKQLKESSKNQRNDQSKDVPSTPTTTTIASTTPVSTPSRTTTTTTTTTPINDDDVAKIQAAYESNIQELQRRLDLEEQTTQALEEYRLNLEQDLHKMTDENDVLSHKLEEILQQSGFALQIPINTTPYGLPPAKQLRILEQDMLEVKSRFSDLLALIDAAI